MTRVRLNKALAQAGLTSRRGADRLIEDGRVTVNGETIADMGRQVDLADDSIKVDGKRLPDPPTIHTYLMLHKERRTEMGQLFHLVGQGVPSVEAFQRAFGMDILTAEKELTSLQEIGITALGY